MRRHAGEVVDGGPDPVGRTPECAVLSRVVGASDYLTKPFDPWVLRAKVETFVGLS